MATPTTMDSWVVNPSMVWQNKAKATARIGPAIKATMRIGELDFEIDPDATDISYILLT